MYLGKPFPSPRFPRFGEPKRFESFGHGGDHWGTRVYPHKLARVLRTFTNQDSGWKGEEQEWAIIYGASRLEESMQSPQLDPPLRSSQLRIRKESHVSSS